MTAEVRTRPLLLGHRGCRLRGIPENTFAAFDHALAAGCDGFEFDVRLTRDAKAICLHDDSLGKTLIQDASYEELCKNYLKDIGVGDPTSMDHLLPCLPDVLKRYGRSAFLNIELKVQGLERSVLELLQAKQSLKNYFISSFVPEVICDIAELSSQSAGEVQLGYLFDNVTGLHDWPYMPGPWVVPRFDLVTQALVDSVHESGRKIMVWTVNRSAEMLRMKDFDVDGLISDDPGLLCRTVRG